MSSARRRAELAARAAVVTGTASEPARPGPDGTPGEPESREPEAAGPEAGEPDREQRAPEQRAPEQRAPEQRAPEQRAPRTRPVRVTVELSPMEHKLLRRWCAQTSADLDLPVVAGAEVFRALLNLMHGRPEVAEQVRAELARTGGSRRRH